MVRSKNSFELNVTAVKNSPTSNMKAHQIYRIMWSLGRYNHCFSAGPKWLCGGLSYGSPWALNEWSIPFVTNKVCTIFETARKSARIAKKSAYHTARTDQLENYTKRQYIWDNFLSLI